MNVKKVKRKCMVRGCKRIDCYAVSLTREMGNSIIICEDCAKALYETLFKDKASVATAENKAAKQPSASPAPGIEEKTAEQALDAGEKVYVCGKCGEAFSDQKAYLLHQKSCGAAKKGGTATKKGGGKK